MMVERGNRHRRDIKEERRHRMRRNGKWRRAGGRRPDSVADQLAKLAEAGADVAIGLPNYLNDLPIVIDEVLPRLEARGLRQFAG